MARLRKRHMTPEQWLGDEGRRLRRRKRILIVAWYVIPSLFIIFLLTRPDAYYDDPDSSARYVILLMIPMITLMKLGPDFVIGRIRRMGGTQLDIAMQSSAAFEALAPELGFTKVKAGDRRWCVHRIQLVDKETTCAWEIKVDGVDILLNTWNYNDAGDTETPHSVLILHCLLPRRGGAFPRQSMLTPRERAKRAGIAGGDIGIAPNMDDLESTDFERAYSQKVVGDTSGLGTRLMLTPDVMTELTDLGDVIVVQNFEHLMLKVDPIRYLPRETGGTPELDRLNRLFQLIVTIDRQSRASD